MSKQSVLIFKIPELFKILNERSSLGKNMFSSRKLCCSGVATINYSGGGGAEGDGPDLPADPEPEEEMLALEDEDLRFHDFESDREREDRRRRGRGKRTKEKNGGEGRNGRRHVVWTGRSLATSLRSHCGQGFRLRLPRSLKGSKRDTRAHEQGKCESDRGMRNQKILKMAKE